MERPNLQEIEERFIAFLKGRRLRKTPERLAILAQVVATGAHFEAEDILRSLEASGYHVSRATVYNTIDLLCQCGIVRRLIFSVHRSCYELTGRSHIHLVCNACGRIREADDPEALRGLDAMKFGGFIPSYSSTTLYGLCSRCARKSKKS